jgi:hypothetical protein
MSLVAAAFLAGFVFLAVPWWLHRLSAHAAEQHTFSSLFLMRRSEAPVLMRRQLQYLWLLALRLLLLAVVCLAFAEPLLELAGTAEEANSTVPDRLIVLDTSLSMNQTVNGGRAIDEAQRIASELVRDVPPGARAALVTVNDQIDLKSPLTTDRAQLNAAITTSDASASRLVLDGLLGRIANLTGTLLAPGEQLEIHLISDFQATAMPDQFNALIDGSIWPVTLHPVAGDEPNWAVTHLAFRHTQASRDIMEVTVHGLATQARTIDVILEQNDTLVERRNVRIPADGSTTVEFELPPAGRGHTTWLARLEVADALIEDNMRHLVQADREQTPLPVFTSEERPYAYLSAAVRAAAPTFLPTREMAGDNFAVPIVVLVDPGVLTSSTNRELMRFLEAGGAVLLTAGPATRSAGRLPLLDVPLLPSRFDQTSRGVVAVDPSHPILSDFATWRDLTVFQVVETVETAAASGIGEMILALDDGTPLLVEHPVGAGRLMVLTTALDPEWTSLVVRPAFVGFMAKVLGYLAEDLLPAEALVGQDFAIPAQSVQLLDATGKRVLGLSDTVGRPTVSLRQPGVYQLRTPSRTRPLAVNTDVRESDLRRAPAELLARWQAATVPTAATPASSTASQSSEESTYIQPLAPWLLALLALLVLAEPLLANLGPTNRLRQEAVTT